MKLSKKKIKQMVNENPNMVYESMPEEIKEMFPVVIPDIASEYFGIHFTTKHNGKMAGFESLSTTCKASAKCAGKIENAFRLVMGSDFVLADASSADIKKARKKLSDYIKKNPLAVNVSICGFCFSDRQQDYMSSMKKPLAKNHDVLNNGVIHPDWLPTLNDLYFRCESFGDYDSKTAVMNTVNLIKKNPDTFFGVWTKNLNYFHQVFKGDPAAVPTNCNIIYSSQYINKVSSVPEKYKYFVSKTFTVYTKEFSEVKDICINCGSRACLTCKKCYQKNNVPEIKEGLK